MDWEESVPNIIHKTRRCGIGILSAELGNVDFLPEKKKSLKEAATHFQTQLSLSRPRILQNLTLTATKAQIFTNI